MAESALAASLLRGEGRDYPVSDRSGSEVSQAAKRVDGLKAR